MSDYKVTDSELTGIANAIRTKGGTSSQLVFPDGFTSAIGAIPTGGGAVNILSGTIEPANDYGSNGAIYLQYMNAGLKNSLYQYINTGYHGNNNSKYKMTFSLSKVQSQQYATPFGSRSAPSAVQNATGAHCQSNQTLYSWGSSQYGLAGSPAGADYIGKICQITQEAGHFEFRANDEVIHDYEFTPTSISDTTPCGIFAYLINGSPMSSGYTDGMILYGFEIYENDVLVHNYIPALDQNDVACVYDTIDEEYLYEANGGTMEFTEAGTIIDCYCKVNGVWLPITEANISDVNTGGGNS